jgi:hypothetical protein
MVKCWTLVEFFFPKAMALLVNSKRVDYDSKSMPHEKIFDTMRISRKTALSNEYENLDL